jgi:hypothetical protein
MLARTNPSFSRSDSLLRNINWECPYSNEHFGHQILENLHTNPIKREIEWTHPLAFAAKASSVDSPTLREIQNMPSPEIDQWYEAIDLELEALQNKQTMIEIKRSQVPPDKQVIKSTWVFRRKRRPSGEIYKLKARFVIRGDLQILDVAQSKFSPLVSWSTVCLLFVLTVSRKLQSKKIDFNNAFVQG